MTGGDELSGNAPSRIVMCRDQEENANGPEVLSHPEAGRTTHPSLPRRTSDTMSVYSNPTPDNPDAPEPLRYPRCVIPTSYRGYRFRSRAEARWAVFFDQLGIGWQYEPQGYVIGDRPYLPDFLLECGTWVEVKGSEDQLDYALMRVAARALPKMPATGERGPRLMCLGPVDAAQQTFEQLPGDYGWLGIDLDGRGDELLFGSYGFGRWEKHRRPWHLGERTGDGPWLRPCFEEWAPSTVQPYRAAIGARFEHGESGAR